MIITSKTYGIIRQIHLYSSLCTVALLLMYVITSYMMIYHDFFKVKEVNKSTQIITINPDEVTDANWNSFLKKNNIKGRLVRENFNESGDMIRRYETAKGSSKISVFNERNEVEIETSELNLSGSIIELHRIRGFGGPFLFNIYAFLLDIMGISLILFVITGVILWLKILNNNYIAWTILALGFIYVGCVIAYLVYL